MQVGDIIIKADGQPVDDAASLQAAVDRSKDRLVLTVLRDGEERNLTVTPVEQDGRKRLGIYVREGIAGVGTVTYYDPESGAFGALGHGVSDPRGNLLPLEAGTALEAEVVSVKKGRAGAPGQLQGAFQKDAVLGELEKNTRCGVLVRQQQDGAEFLCQLRKPRRFIRERQQFCLTFPEQRYGSILWRF